MKKLGILSALTIVLISFSTASADLIGVLPLITNQYPDIVFNNTGAIDYDSLTDQFSLTADGLKIAYSPTEFYYLSGPGVHTAMSLDLNVDENGDMTGIGMMVEIVADGDVTIRNQVYGTGTVLLTGSVYDFGWGEAGAVLGDFDFLINNATGALISDGLWPDNVDIGIIAFAETLNGWAGSWNTDFHLDKVKGDKAPIPEPTTVILLSLGGLLLRKRK